MRNIYKKLFRKLRKTPGLPAAYAGPGIVYTHIPKCGGTSVDAAMRSSIGLTEQPRINPIAARKATHLVSDVSNPAEFLDLHTIYIQYLLCYHLNLGWKFVSGHLPVNQDILEFYSQYKFVTILRNPVDRWISHYLYNKLTNPDPMVPPYKDFQGTIEEEFDHVIDSGRGAQMGSLITTMLTGKYAKTRDEAIDLSLQASLNIQKYSVIGFLHDLDSFEAKISELTSTEIRIGHHNRTQRDHVKDQQNRYCKLNEFFKHEDVLGRINECCFADMKVYEHALALE